MTVPAQDALENDTFGWNDRRHMTDYHPRNLSPLRECSLFKAADDAALRHGNEPTVSIR